MMGAVLETGFEALVVLIAAGAAVSLVVGNRLWRRPASAWQRWRARRAPASPPHRPIEILAGRLRVLGRLHRAPPPGTRFVKREAIRQAYDALLAEACDELDIPQLLGVIPPGSELDRERARVEWAVECAGLDLALPLT